MQIAWSKRFDLPWISYLPGSAGAIMLSDTSIICGLMDAGSFPFQMNFYRSTDNGLTWTFRSALETAEQQYGPRMLHWPENILSIILGNSDEQELFVYRSTNAAASWSLQQIIPNGGTTANGPWTQHSCTFLRSAGAVVGRPRRNNAGHATSELYYTTNKGLSWTDGGMISPGGGNNLIECIAAKPGENFLIGGAPQTMYSANPLTTHSLLSTFPVPSNPPAPNAAMDCLDVIWLTDTLVIAAGFGQGGGDEHYPYIFTSSDSGATWTPVDRGNIDGWPTTGFQHPGVRVVQRLTRDAALLGVYLTDGTNPAPVLLSIDHGEHWLDVNTGFGGWGAGGISGQGGMVTTLDGSIIAIFDISAGSDSRAEIWHGVLTC